jgi:pantetheine-phosphate adenylyltransferase
MPTRTAVFPGTFDPVSCGHLDVIRRAARLFDRLVVAVADSRAGTLLSRDERLALLRENVQGMGGVDVATFDGLLVDLARRLGAVALIRGVRTYQDWEYELRMVQMNRHLAPSLETVFLAPSAEHAFISGSLIREVAALGADLTGLVPENVARALARRPRRGGPSE